MRYTPNIRLIHNVIIASKWCRKDVWRNIYVNDLRYDTSRKICTTNCKTNCMVAHAVSRQTSRAIYLPMILRDWWHEQWWRTYTAGFTIMYDLFATSSDLYSQVQSFEHGHRPCYEQSCWYDYTRFLRSIAAQYVSDLSAIHLTLCSSIGRDVVVSPVWLGSYDPLPSDLWVT